MPAGEPEPDAAQVLEALHRIALAMSDTSDSAALAALVARSARELLRADDVVLYIWDTQAQVLRLAYGENTGHVLRATMAAGEGAIGRAYVSGEPSVVTDYPNWEGAIPELVEHGVKRVAAVPLKIDSRVVGVLAVRFLAPRGCEPSHVRALQLLAAPVAAILEAALARQRAEAGEARLAAIVDNLPCGVLVRDAAGQAVLMNETARSMASGVTEGRRLGLDHIEQLEVFEPRTRRRLAPHELPTARALRGEYVVDREVGVKLPDSDLHAWVRISAVPLRAPDQVICGAVAIFTDVSRERQLLHNLHLSASENTRLMAELQEAQQRHQELLASLRPAESAASPATLVSGRLSAREREVLARIGRGETNRQIGAALGLSAGTVKKHVEHILRKLGVTDRTHAAVRAAELGRADRPE
jgi:DNA-binding CsgD family transcriptional regulator/PAS domain-containing protein